jgi:LuxR family transcriptional regulator, activator of conjugal transfer of Ti plasmids
MKQYDVLDRVEKFIGEVDAAPDVEGVRDVLDKHTRQLGFDRFSYQNLVPPTGIVNRFYVSTYPREWIARYNVGKYISNDLVSLSAARYARPYSWHEIGRLSDFTPEQRISFDEATEFGIRTGASVPICGPGCVKAMLAVACDLAQDEFEKLFLAQRHVLHLIAAYAHERLVALRFFEHQVHNLNLTPRETEVLTWGARGKTNPEIADILSISQNTVTSHFRNACTKLGGANKTHAIALALKHRIVLP